VFTSVITHSFMPLHGRMERWPGPSLSFLLPLSHYIITAYFYLFLPLDSKILKKQSLSYSYLYIATSSFSHGVYSLKIFAKYMTFPGAGGSHYMGACNLENLGSRPTQGRGGGRQLLWPHLNRKKLGIVACACHPSNSRRISV
jgi:hypothetical protein